MAKKKKRRLWGRHLLTLGALALFGVSGYELWIRLEDFWAWTQGIRHLSAVQHTSFIANMGIIFEAPEMQQLGYKLLFLCFCILFGLICLIRRNRSRGVWLLMLLDIATGVGGWLLGVYGFHPADWAQTLKLLPLALILAGCIANMAHGAAIRKRREARRRVARSPRGEQPGPESRQPL